jgi:hypothetical protein
MIAVDEVTRPPALASIDETGLAPDLILQIVTKTLHLAGELTGIELGERLSVSGSRSSNRL